MNAALDTARPSTALAGAVAAVAATGCSGVQSMLDPAGPAARAIAGLWWWMLAGAVGVLGLVLALLWWALARPRHRLAVDRGLGLIVAGGIVMPSVLLIVLLVFGTRVGVTAKTLGASPRHVVGVEGRQWAWTFRYHDRHGRVVASTTDRLVLPLGRSVEFHVTSRDVIHSFWIPRLGGKIDAIPGRTNLIRLQADDAGPMRGQCAEFCGLRHAHMAFDVDVVPAAAFERWLRDAAQADGVAASGAGPGAAAGEPVR